MVPHIADVAVTGWGYRGRTPSLTIDSVSTGLIRCTREGRRVTSIDPRLVPRCGQADGLKPTRGQSVIAFCLTRSGRDCHDGTIDGGLCTMWPTRGREFERRCNTGLLSIKLQMTVMPARRDMRKEREHTCPLGTPHPFVSVDPKHDGACGL